METAMRTHYCGLIDEDLIDQTVTLCGWVDRRRDHGGVIFLDMRDREGVVQVVFDPDTEEHFQRADSVRSEYVLRITGRVRARTAETVNPNMASGKIEVLGKSLEILNAAQTPPFPLDEHHSVGEDVRLRYRFMDLRRPEMQQNLIARAKITSSIRRYLDEQGFLDIETPILTRATPEGARDYLVPSRTQPGAFCIAPVPPAVQAVADGLWVRSLLPNRALLPRRGSSGGQTARIHPDRHRNGVSKCRRGDVDH